MVTTKITIIIVTASDLKVGDKIIPTPTRVGGWITSIQDSVREPGNRMVATTVNGATSAGTIAPDTSIAILGR